MSLQYIVDGYNVINNPQFPRPQKTKDTRRALLELIKAKKLCGSSRNKITVVFDGYPDSQEIKQDYTDINVIFSRKETADERIKSIVESSGNAKDIAVVSDDKEIRFFVKATGGRTISVGEFIDRKEKLQRQGRDLLKTELTYSQMQKINQELKKIWLK